MRTSCFVEDSIPRRKKNSFVIAIGNFSFVIYFVFVSCIFVDRFVRAGTLTTHEITRKVSLQMTNVKCPMTNVKRFSLLVEMPLNLHSLKLVPPIGRLSYLLCKNFVTVSANR